MLHSSLLLTALFAASALSSPMAQDDKKPNPAAEKCHGINGPFLNPSFPDPSMTFEHDNWFSFGTFNGNDFRAAKSGKLESGWERVQGKVLDIGKATWAGKPKDGNYGLWAPDVFRRHHDNKFVMYFAAHDKETIGTNKIKHCIGAAISDNIGGVYVPQSDFVQCNRTASGVIDPAWFRDTDNKQYVVYKTEIPENWLEIREVRNSGPKEGLEWVSHAHRLIQVNSQGHSDGNNIEAPYIFKRGDVYFLAYSTHFTGDGSYDVQYAVAKNVKGPYKRVKEPLLKTTDAFGCKLIGPGGASFYRPSAGNEKIVMMIFHGLSGTSGMNGRVAYTATVEVDGEKLSIKTK